MDIAGKAAIVTGAGSGIGRGIALALARAGCDVLVSDINGDAAEAVAGEVRDLGVRGLASAVDVSDEQAVEALIEQGWGEFSELALLFNNAGVVVSKPGMETSAQDLRWIFAVNMFGMWHGTLAFSRRLVEAGRNGWICNTASENALAAQSTHTAAYTASKHAVLGFTSVLRNELKSNVGFSLLCPGVVRTGLWQAGRSRQADFGGPGGDVEISRIALGYGIDPEDVGTRTVAGVAAEEFFIFTHQHVIEGPRQRMAELEEAMARQIPVRPADEMTTFEVQAKVRADFQGGR